ncbi:MAG: hypothetical protein ACK47J_02140 [Pseudanabaena sp.]
MMNTSSPSQVWKWLSQHIYGLYLTIALAGIAYLLRNLPIFALFSP